MEAQLLKIREMKFALNLSIERTRNNKQFSENEIWILNCSLKISRRKSPRIFDSARTRISFFGVKIKNPGPYQKSKSRTGPSHSNLQRIGTITLQNLQLVSHIHGVYENKKFYLCFLWYGKLVCPASFEGKKIRAEIKSWATCLKGDEAMKMVNKRVTDQQNADHHEFLTTGAESFHNGKLGNYCFTKNKIRTPQISSISFLVSLLVWKRGF